MSSNNAVLNFESEIATTIEKIDMKTLVLEFIFTWLNLFHKTIWFEANLSCLILIGKFLAKWNYYDSSPTKNWTNFNFAPKNNNMTSILR